MVVKVSLHDPSRNQSIDLSHEQTTIIGRGFFACQDKRVSKRHGEITILETTIKVKSCHSNPIFYKLKNDPGGKKVLRKDSEVVLGDNDVFSLLPDEFEWTVKIHQENPAPTFRVRRTQEINDNLTQLLREGSITPDLERTPSPDNLRRPENLEPASSTSRKRSCDESGESSDAKKKRDEVPTSTTSEATNPDLVPQASIESNSSTETLPNIKHDPDSTDAKQPSSNLPTTSIEIKIEPVDNPQPAATSTTDSNVKADPDAVKTEDDACCGQQSNNVRPSCEFGIRCYRMTDDHRREYAHPMDCDYRRPALANLAPPDAPRCPYWDGCYRRNPEHFRDFQHPPSDQYAPQRAPQIHLQVIQPQAVNLQNRPARNRNVINNRDEDSDSDRIGWDDDEDDFNNSDDSDLDRNFEMSGSISDIDEDDLDEEENNLEE